MTARVVGVSRQARQLRRARERAFRWKLWAFSLLVSVVILVVGPSVLRDPEPVRVGPVSTETQP